MTLSAAGVAFAVRLVQGTQRVLHDRHADVEEVRRVAAHRIHAETSHHVARCADVDLGALTSPSPCMRSSNLHMTGPGVLKSKKDRGYVDMQTYRQL